MVRIKDSISSLFKRYWRDTRANVAVLFGLSIVPILMVAGFSIDYSRQVTSDQHLQAAIDATSLVSARALEDAMITDLEIETIAQASYRKNLGTSHKDLNCDPADIDIDRVRGIVTVKADCKLATMFGGSVWKKEVGVSASASARAAITKLDIAFMLDVSGSMGGQKLEDLKSAAKRAAATLITPKTGDRVRVSFNSYATSVNAGVYAAKVMDEPVSNCVSEREGQGAWRDDAPGLGKWLGDEANACPSSSVLPLTNDLSLFNSNIDALTAGGRTAGHLGVAWSWYLISPEWDEIWPAASKPRAYGEINSQKAVILMTDGKFNQSYSGLLGSSNVQAKRLCTEMRDAGVIIYSVAFQAPSSAKATLKNCAGTPDRFFNADDGDELLAAYDAIASHLSNLALIG